MIPDKIRAGDLVQAHVTEQIPLEFVVPKPLLHGEPALYLGDRGAAGDWVSYVLYSGKVLVISKEKLIKCIVPFTQA